MLLDNCEHLLDDVGDLAERILGQVPAREAAGDQPRGARGRRRARRPPAVARRSPTPRPPPPSWRGAPPSGCSSTGPATPAPRAPGPTSSGARSRRSAGGSTASRSPSSWPRRAVASMSPAEIAGHLDERFRLLTGKRRASRRAPTDPAGDGRLVVPVARRRRPARSSTGSACSRARSTPTAPPRSSSDDMLDAWGVIDSIASLVAKSMLVPETGPPPPPATPCSRPCGSSRGAARHGRRRRPVASPARRALRRIHSSGDGGRPSRRRGKVVFAGRHGDRQSPGRGAVEPRLRGRQRRRAWDFTSSPR